MEAFFIIDTGSDITCLEKVYARSFGFRYRRSNSGRVISGVNSTSNSHFTVYDAEIHLSGVRFFGKFKAMYISHIIESIYQDTGLHINGIIGSDVIKQCRFVIDYFNEQISFYEF